MIRLFVQKVRKALNKLQGIEKDIIKDVYRDGLSYGNNPKIIALHHPDVVSFSIKDIHKWHLENG